MDGVPIKCQHFESVCANSACGNISQAGVHSSALHLNCVFDEQMCKSIAKTK